MAESKNIEEMSLKLFKLAALSIMGLALVAILFFVALAGIQFSKTPVEPAPAQKAPEKQINLDDLKRFLIEEEKRNSGKGDNTKSPTGAAIHASRYAETALALFRCAATFSSVTGRGDLTNEKVNAESREKMRVWVEERADKPSRGEAWVKSSEIFTCKVLADPSIIALAKEDKPGVDKIGAVFQPTREFHLSAWDRIQEEKQQFEQAERNRVASERAAEISRVAAAKRAGAEYLIAAGIAFGLFMVLAFYFLLAKIENDLRDINQSIRSRQEQKIS